jgi:hypothetical protein
MPVCCECCVLSGRGLCDRACHSSRGVVPPAVRRCVWSRNLVSEEALAHLGLLRQKKKKSDYVSNRVKRRLSDMLDTKISEVMQTEEIYETVILAHHQSRW